MKERITEAYVKVPEKKIKRERLLSRILTVPAVGAAIFGILQILSNETGSGLIALATSAATGIPAIKTHRSFKRAAQHNNYIEHIVRKK